MKLSHDMQKLYIDFILELYWTESPTQETLEIFTERIQQKFDHIMGVLHEKK